MCSEEGALLIASCGLSLLNNLCVHVCVRERERERERGGGAGERERERKRERGRKIYIYIYIERETYRETEQIRNRASKFRGRLLEVLT